MSRNAKTAGAIALAALTVAGAWLALRLWLPGTRTRLSPSQSPRAESSPARPPGATPAEAPFRIQSYADALRQSRGAEAARDLFARLGRALAELSPETASAVIREFLESKIDAASGLPFKIGPDGLLTSCPSLRIFLLDYLARVDPDGAAVYTRETLARMESPDEWAVALRNYARAKPTADGKGFLEEKMEDLLAHEAWQKNPSVGYLQAFDLAVHVGGTNLMPSLASLLQRRENPALAHAAYLALDRLAINDPAHTLNKLLHEPQLMQGREVTRANYFARADVRDPQQRLLLEHYLLVFNAGSEELNTFLGLYPNANFMVSHNLVTRTSTPDRATLDQRDRAALLAVQDWLADPRFAQLKPQLQSVRQRLESFLLRPPNTAPEP